MIRTLALAGFVAALLAPAGPLNAGTATVATTQVAPAALKTALPAAAKPLIRYTTAGLNLRAGAGTHHRSLKVIPRNTKVAVTSSQNGWSKMSHQGKTGWASAKYLAVSKPKAASKSKAAKKPTGLATKARGIANKYGCSRVGITWNDRRLGRANGAADWNSNKILLKSSMPAYRLTYVVAHECMHFKQYWAYKGDWTRMARDHNKVYGRTGTSYYGLERIADCMTQSKGIKVYHYTNSCSSAAKKAASRILTGKQL